MSDNGIVDDDTAESRSSNSSCLVDIANGGDRQTLAAPLGSRAATLTALSGNPLHGTVAPPIVPGVINP